jgi:membrane-associated phospholipid phosphatase
LLLAALLVALDANRAVFLALNRAGAPLGENVWANLTLLGDGAIVLALVLPCIRRSPQCFWAALVAAVLASLYVQGIKQVINIPRPLAVLAADAFFQAGPPYKAVSFPSGHSAAIFAIVGIWVMGVRGRYLLRVALLVLAVLVSLSRVMLGVHWPLDLLGGMLGGWAAAWCGLACYARWGWRTSGLCGMGAGLVLLVLAGALLFSKHIGIAAVLPLQRTIGLVCLLWGAREMLQVLPRWQWRRDPEGE